MNEWTNWGNSRRRNKRRRRKKRRNRRLGLLDDKYHQRGGRHNKAGLHRIEENVEEIMPSLTSSSFLSFFRHNPKQKHSNPKQEHKQRQLRPPSSKYVQSSQEFKQKVMACFTIGAEKAALIFNERQLKKKQHHIYNNQHLHPVNINKTFNKSEDLLTSTSTSLLSTNITSKKNSTSTSISTSTSTSFQTVHPIQFTLEINRESGALGNIQQMAISYALTPLLITETGTQWTDEIIAGRVLKQLPTLIMHPTPPSPLPTDLSIVREKGVVIGTSGGQQHEVSSSNYPFYMRKICFDKDRCLSSHKCWYLRGFCVFRD
mmetsp:Transcript_25653/g.33386  ORF Transcript_25653/g.33386 Transcript_25653/m.33386 type:complete len:317 (+) Transcript_25653:496-1446(+)